MNPRLLALIIGGFVLLVLANAIVNAFDPPEPPLLIDGPTHAAAVDQDEPAAFLVAPCPLGPQNIPPRRPLITRA